MTLAEASPGAQIIVDTIKAATKLKKSLSQKGLETGAIVQVEKTDTSSDLLVVNIKGYHIPITRSDAAKILVKPI